MTKGPGKKHYQPEDHEHAAHQSEAAGHQERDAKKVRPTGMSDGQHGGHPVEGHPKSPRRGQ